VQDLCRRFLEQIEASKLNESNIERIQIYKRQWLHVQDMKNHSNKKFPYLVSNMKKMMNNMSLWKVQVQMCQSVNIQFATN